MYSPLALASLEDVLSSHRLNLAAQIALLIDYLRGLVYLHDSKGIMHRDIKPGNLGVLSFSPFAGILLDLDAATTDTRSDDHGQGTITYLAPEIINLKLDSTEEREKYGSQADVWALGMSAFFALTGRHVWWNDFADEWDEWPKGSSLPNTKDTNFVLKDRLARFHHSYEQKKPQNIYFRQYFDLLKPMTAYKPVHRHSASEALGIAEKLAKEWGEAKMFARESTQGIKRKIGEI